MMSRLLASAGLALGLALPAAAFDMSAMTDAERDAFRAEIRSYLLENPEVLLEAIQVLEDREAVAQAENDAALLQANAAEIFDDPDSWVGGNPDGDVTVVEFLDYRCGYCKRAHPEVLQLLESDGNIRYIVKEFPILGEQSVLASQFAIAVLRHEGGDAYAEANDELMNFRGNITKESLAGLSDEMGLDTAGVLAMMDDPEIERVIAENRQLAQTLAINGTPSFIFETEMLRGYAPLDAMQAVVAQVRAQ